MTPFFINIEVPWLSDPVSDTTVANWLTIWKLPAGTIMSEGSVKDPFATLVNSGSPDMSPSHSKATSPSLKINTLLNACSAWPPTALIPIG